MITLIGSFAAVLTTACWLPQVVKTVRLGTADDFAWPYLCMLLVGITAWTVYGVLRHDPPIYLCNSITGCLVMGVAFVKVRGDRTVPVAEVAVAVRGDGGLSGSPVRPLVRRPTLTRMSENQGAAMSTQVTIIGGGQLPVGTRADGRPVRHPLLAGMHLVLQDIDPDPAAEDGGAGPQGDRRPGTPRRPWRSRPTSRRRWRAPTSSSSASRPGGSAPWRSTSTCRRRTASPRPWGTASARAASTGPCATSRCWSGIGHAMEEVCPDAWLFNITNPMTTLTRVGVPRDQHQDRRPLPRSGQLHHGSGHRPPQALGGGRAHRSSG